MPGNSSKNFFLTKQLFTEQQKNITAWKKEDIKFDLLRLASEKLDLKK